MNVVKKKDYKKRILVTVELQWLEHLWDHEKMFERRVVKAYES